MKTLMIATALAALSLSTASAQNFAGVRVHFDEPVQAAGNTLPAGDYSITLIRSNSDMPLLRFSSDKGTNVVVFASRITHANGEATRTDVVLDKSGSVERVKLIEMEGSDVDFVLPLSNR